jgi:hypothetical protein
MDRRGFIASAGAASLVASSSALAQKGMSASRKKFKSTGNVLLLDFAASEFAKGKNA